MSTREPVAVNSAVPVPVKSTGVRDEAGATRPGTALIPNERSTKRRDFGTFPSITPSCTAHESLEMPPNAAATGYALFDFPIH